jgi:hypothetical protein
MLTQPVRAVQPPRPAMSGDSFIGPKPSSLEQLYAVAKQGLLGVLFVMANDAHSPKQWKSWFIVGFHMLQVLAVPLLLFTTRPPSIHICVHSVMCCERMRCLLGVGIMGWCWWCVRSQPGPTRLGRPF